MRRMVLLLALLLGLTALVHADQSPVPARVVVGEGTALLGDDPLAADEEALWEAKRNAVEQAFGQTVRATEFGRDYALEESEVWGSAEGFVQHWELIPGSRYVETVEGSRVIHVKIRATVAPLTAIHRLSDLNDVYTDLSRPRIRVIIEGDRSARKVQDSLIAGLRADGFEIANDERADITLTGHLALSPTIHLGDNNTPYGLGSSVAACKAQLTVRLVSHNSEEILLYAHSDGSGQSFQSDAEAASKAASQAGNQLLSTNQALFTRNLLQRWAQERIEGYVACLEITGLDSSRDDLLRQHLREQRGFRRFVEDTRKDQKLTLRFLTRSDMQTLRQRLPEMNLKGMALRVQKGQGAFIECTANRAPQPANARSKHTENGP